VGVTVDWTLVGLTAALAPFPIIACLGIYAALTL
jgi:hypothetical protein